MPVNTRKLWAQLPKFMRKHRTIRTNLFTYNEAFDGENKQARERDASIEEANVITSVDVDSFGAFHRPVLDIDFEAQLIPSSTEGHYHLYLDKLIPTQDYFKLLDALAEAQIIEPAVANYAKERGYSAVRLPWRNKDSERDNAYDPTEWQATASDELRDAEKRVEELKAQLANDPWWR